MFEAIAEGVGGVKNGKGGHDGIVLQLWLFDRPATRRLSSRQPVIPSDGLARIDSPASARRKEGSWQRGARRTGQRLR